MPTGRKQMKSLIKTLGLCLVGASMLIGPASAQDYKSEYKVSTIVPAPFPWGIAAERWVELVRERTDGRINMKIYPGAQLVAGDQSKEFTAMRQGIIDMAIGSTINWSAQVPELNLFSLPFLLPDYKAIDVLTEGEVGKQLFEKVEQRGVVPLAWGENGFRELTNSKKPVRTPADLKGLKIRVTGSPLFQETFTALGANPTQMSWSDAVPALTTGAVDGQENPLPGYVIAKLHNMGQSHVTLWHYVADPLIFAANKEVWASFTEEDRKIVADAALEAAKLNVELAREGVTKDDTSVLSKIEGFGVDIVHLTPENHQAFRDATRPTYEKWKERVGVDLVKQAEEAIANR